jgi:hypothetical protein
VGSNPSVSLRQRLEAEAWVELQSDVEEPMRYVQGARLMLNPVSTGSGVQLKSVDMLMGYAPIVTFEQGVRGLTEEVRRQFCVASSERAFVDTVLEMIEDHSFAKTRRMPLRALSVAAVQDALEAAL